MGFEKHDECVHGLSYIMVILDCILCTEHRCICISTTGCVCMGLLLKRNKRHMISELVLLNEKHKWITLYLILIMGYLLAYKRVYEIMDYRYHCLNTTKRKA